MKKHRTSIRNLTQILYTNPIVEIVKAESHYKSQSMCEERDYIDTSKLLMSIVLLSQTMFAESIAWTYESVLARTDSEDFIIYGDWNDRNIGQVTVIHIRAKPGVASDEIEKELGKTLFREY